MIRTFGFEHVEFHKSTPCHLLYYTGPPRINKWEIHYCLGMSITSDRASMILMINQRTYLENVLKRFHMSDFNSVSTQIEIGKRFEEVKDRENAANQKEYQAAIASLTYAAIAERPDISFPVRVLSQFMSCLGQEHFKGAKIILRLFKRNVGLWFKVF